MLSIAKNTVDSFDRYKMPRIVVKLEGKGNGTKTLLENLESIGKSLGRHPLYLLKFVGYEVCAQTQAENTKYIVRGWHKASDLQDIIYWFIELYVVCSQCENPETSLYVKRHCVFRKCSACGHTDPLDMNHKLCNYIAKTPLK